jgi:hypothetical protein
MKVITVNIEYTRLELGYLYTEESAYLVIIVGHSRQSVSRANARVYDLQLKLCDGGSRCLVLVTVLRRVFSSHNNCIDTSILII